ncbi:hypothetical protein [Tateyamaria sp.]|uniref:hypothetical protein n=1 Tax=Tateyamaria sp. TaxID=1929288 RepID=UPI00329CDC0D
MSEFEQYQPNQANYRQTTNRLGWASTPTRKILVARHVLRLIGVLNPEMFDEEHGTYLAQLLRSLLDCSLPPSSQSLFHSAPYIPSDRPDTYCLARARRERLVSIDTRLINGESKITFTSDVGRNGQSAIAMFKSSYVPEMNQADGVFAFEIDRVTSGTGLSTKIIAQGRAEILTRQPLWLGGDPLKLEKAGRQFFNKVCDLSSPTRFWHRWYLQLLDGTFRDWELAMEIVKIPNDVWNAGLVAAAEEIRRIEARLLSERMPQVEEIFKTDLGFYDVRSVISEPSKLIDSIESRVRFALDLAVQSNSCDLNDMSTAAKVLRHALDNCLDDPNALEQFLRRGSGMIKARITDGTFSGDDELGVLVDTLDELALQLRADHPEVAQAVDARTRQRFKELDDKKRLLGATLIDDLKEGTTGRLETELDLASETLRDGISDDASTDALKQSGNRAAKISLAERAKQAESSGTMAALKMGLRSNKLVEFVMDLFSGGGLP